MWERRRGGGGVRGVLGGRAGKEKGLGNEKPCFPIKNLVTGLRNEKGPLEGGRCCHTLGILEGELMQRYEEWIEEQGSGSRETSGRLGPESQNELRTAQANVGVKGAQERMG